MNWSTAADPSRPEEGHPQTSNQGTPRRACRWPRPERTWAAAQALVDVHGVVTKRTKAALRVHAVAEHGLNDRIDPANASSSARGLKGRQSARDGRGRGAGRSPGDDGRRAVAVGAALTVAVDAGQDRGSGHEVGVALGPQAPRLAAAGPRQGS